MKQLYFVVLLMFFASLSMAQSSFDRTGEDFAFIEKGTDTSSLRYIRTFKCVSKPGDDIPSLYRAINAQAKYLGANCFRYKSFMRDTSGTITLVLETYSARESVLQENYLRHTKNDVYIFSDDKFNGKTHSFSINGTRMKIKSGSYFRRAIEPGGKMKINKGDMLGITVTVKWEENRVSRYFTMTGYGLADLNPASTTGSVSSFSTGKFKYLDNDLARLLAIILKAEE